MAKIYQFPRLRTPRQPQCATCKTWLMADRDFKNLYENITLYVTTSDEYLIHAILHASKNRKPSPIEIASAWQLGSIHYSDKKLRTIFKSTYQSLTQIRSMLMDVTANEKHCMTGAINSTCLQGTYGLKKMRAYTIFKIICLASLTGENGEYWLDKKISPSSFSQVLLENLIQDGFFKGST